MLFRLVLAFMAAAIGSAMAQPAPGGLTGAWYPAGACGTVSYTATAMPQAITIDGNGYLCVKSSSTISGTVDTNVKQVGGGTVPSLGTGILGTALAPTAAAAAGITPVVSTSLENSHVLKAGAGNVYSVYAAALTGGTSGFLVLLNATSAPVDGAITPLAIAPFSGGVAIINYAGLPPGVFSTGITAVVTSASTPFTKTTGVLTAYISGMVQ